MTRCCGERTAGSVYLVTNLSTDPGAWPLEKFLFDPVPPVPDPKALGISAQGMSLHPAHDGRQCLDLWDWIGAGTGPWGHGYWNMWDYLEEGRVQGFSAKVPRTLFQSEEAKQINLSSRHILIHPHAFLTNSPTYIDARLGKCPTGNQACLDSGGYACVGLPREATEGGTVIHSDERAVERHLPPFLLLGQTNTHYIGWRSPDGIQPNWLPGLFAWLPISELHVILDAAASTHETALQLLEDSGMNLPYHVERE